MVSTTVGASVAPNKKAKLIETAGANGKTVNAVLNDLIDGYLNNHDKLEHPGKFNPTPEAETLVIEAPDEEEIEITGDEEEWGKEFLNEMWDTFRDYAKERGYTLVKTENLHKLLDFMKRKAKVKHVEKLKIEPPEDEDEKELEIGKDEKEEEYKCGECGHIANFKFTKCPKCHRKVAGWE